MTNRRCTRFLVPAGLLLASALPAPSQPAKAASPASPADSEAAAPAASRPPRDPFWPLDYTPPPETEPSRAASHQPATPQPERTISEPDWAEAEKTAGIHPVRYSLGTSADGAAFLLFQGKIRAQGELVTQKWKGVEFRWRIASIAGGRAVFERLDAKAGP